MNGSLQNLSYPTTFAPSPHQQYPANHHGHTFSVGCLGGVGRGGMKQINWTGYNFGTDIDVPWP